MKLKRLEIQGFKSFADKTEIVFEQGTTAIGRAFAAHLGPYAVETGFVLVI